MCHLWPETCYDERYHTSLANLVLPPLPWRVSLITTRLLPNVSATGPTNYWLVSGRGEHPVKRVGYPAASDWAPLLPILQSIRHKLGI